jgi:hypothetical protein
MKSQAKKAPSQAWPSHKVLQIVAADLRRRNFSRKSKRYQSTSLRRGLVAVLAALGIGLATGVLEAAQTAMVSVVPDADSFVRSLAPTSNYGAGGALSVSGSAAFNGSGEQNGSFDTLMRFPMSNLVASLDSALGTQHWIVTEIRLELIESAAPDSSIFNRGVGQFEVRWMGSDGWVEGTGKPSAPTTDGVAWQDLPLIVNSNLDVSLGVFTNSGVNGQLSANLALVDRFLEDLRTGGELSLQLTARSPEIGFTFNSRNFGNTNSQPVLVVRAAANPMPRIETVAIARSTVTISFGTVSNWAYTLQGATGLESAAPAIWSNLLTIPAQPNGTNVVFVEAATNSQRLYRLSVSQ